MSVKKKVLNIAVFLLVMFLTFYALFSGRDLTEIARSVAKMSPWYLIPAVALAIFFVCAEGFMIWYLLNAMRDKKNSLFRCFQYSFIGFFYSGITPSATGGQPIQLYYMNKDGNRVSDSTVVLMTVAVVYKFVLVVLGFGILLFWYHPLRAELNSYFPLYLLGLMLNVILVVLILGVMLFPKVILKTAKFFEGILIRMKIWKPSQKRDEKICGFIESYQQAVTWLGKHKGRLAGVVVVTFLQRCSLFVLTYVVYLGFGLKGTDAMTVILLQASVYIAVDMLPLPGAQGITELMYQAVFSQVFTGSYLIPSMLVSRGLNFYFLLIVSLGVVLVNRFVLDRRRRQVQRG
ncbi:lysylphosphatidylglycerol synthetase [Lachnoclostridium sp. An169]|uniref:lysylphosphatidylglycerol synthase transmembrane domain-containing protein n=1 Tax=Lachnoclostridium sp. An169 TaxID=1965569 RepID=UPI000B38B888|nr:lysylphosphatidylglycerol synthase transmembrane domain-containing protein [Lachnoclostridium sp. An169]OUP86701.1 lysylphosphatidylglycerol synthetase [Lachnoclostridium sp. An169]HJA65757.1 flippase-like domain-containing protein [Candidatus Mediterraneibacter cottocaccae]